VLIHELSPPEWVRDAVFYQIFPDRFRDGDPRNNPPRTQPWSGLPTHRSFSGGDLEGILEKLPYLADLGVTALYLTPIFTASTNHKYDGEDYFQVDPAFGGNEAFRELVAALHARGMRVVLDGVFNHCGIGHPFFRDVAERGRGSPYWDWFMIHGDRLRLEPEPNYRCWAGCTGLPEWNHDNPAVRDYLLSVVRHWLREYAIDGWRLDTVEYLPPDFVRDVYRVAKETNPDAYVLGEVMGLATPWFRHRSLDGVMHYKLWEGLVHFLAEGSWDAPSSPATRRGSGQATRLRRTTAATHCWGATTSRGSSPCAAGTRGSLRSPRRSCLRTLGRRRSTTGTRSGWRAERIQTVGAPSRGTRGVGAPGFARRSRR